MIGNINNTDSFDITSNQARNAMMKVLVSPKDGWDGYVMREVILDKDGYSPQHVHPWPHINYVLEGQGYLLMEEEKHPISTGSYAYVPSNILHQYVNTGEGVLRFICIVPEIGHKI